MSYQCNFFSAANDKLGFMKEFISFPEKLYADRLEIKKYPFELEAAYFKLHSLPHDFFILMSGSEIVLRTMICQTPHQGICYFGLFDFDYKRFDVDSVLNEFKKIISECAVKWGADKIVGPINFSTWLSYRLFSFRDGGESFSFEPDRPIEYCELLKKHGFVTNQLFSSKGYDQLDNILNLSKGEYDRAIAANYKFQWLSKELTELDLRDMHRLSTSIFKENYLATPIDFPTFCTLYAAQAKKDDYSHSFFIVSESGQRVGFFINFIEHGYCIIKTIGIERAHRGTGISNGGMYLSLSKMAEMGIHKMVAAMVKEGAQSESYGKKMRLLWCHLYEILTLNL